MARTTARKNDNDLNLRRSRWRFFLVITFASILGALFWATDFARGLEAQYGLPLAFKLRGEIPVPDDVVYVGISHRSAQALKQESIHDLPEWDRGLFAELVQNLSSAGVAAVAFDVLFVKAKSESDGAFSRAMREAGNIVLLIWPQRKIEKIGAIEAITDEIDMPASMFAEAAAAVAPMPLVDDLKKYRVFNFPWVSGARSTGLPLLALYLSQLEESRELSKRCLGDSWESAMDTAGKAWGAINEEIVRLRDALSVPSLAASTDCQRLRTSVVGRALLGNNLRHLNFYGPPGALAGPELHELLGSNGKNIAETLRDKIVVIGIADNHATNPPDSFRSASGTHKYSGVEIATTAIANLSAGDDIRLLEPGRAAVLLILLAMAICALVFYLPAGWALPALTAVVVAYLITATRLFAGEQLWLPLIVPLFVLTPLATLLGWRMKLIDMQQTAQTLGQFVPGLIVDLIKGRKPIPTHSDSSYGVCLHTDVAGYTILAERFSSSPEELKPLEEAYWRLLDREIVKHDGLRLEIAGDGMTCVWTGPDNDVKLRRRACLAAIGIRQAVDTYNAAHPDTQFPTRIGLHIGRVALGLIGGESRYDLAVGGDVANTAARIESEINKLLGTRLLVSAPVVADLDIGPHRKVGTFKLRGKLETIDVHELMHEDDPMRGHIEAFEQALTHFSIGAWQQALDGFQSLLELSPADGPSRFYAELAKRYLSNTAAPPDHMRPGVVEPSQL